MSRTSEIQNLVLTQYNNTDNEQEIQFIERDFSNAKLFESTQDLNVSITRMKIPFQSTELLKIYSSTDPDWKIDLSINCCVSGGGVENDMTYFKGYDYLYNRDVFKIYTPSDFIENTNKCFIRAYSNLIENMYYYSGGVKKFWFKEYTCPEFNFKNATQVQTIDLSSFFATDSSPSYIELRCISSIDQGTNPNPPMINVSLTSPDNIVCKVISGVRVDKLAGIWFSDGFPDNNEVIIQTGFPVHTRMNPIDAFSKFQTGTSVKNSPFWKITVSPNGDGNLDCKLQFILKVVQRPTNPSLSAMPPYLSLNRSTSFFSMNYPELLIDKGLQIQCIGLLNRILNHTLNSPSTYIERPVLSLSSTLDKVISIEQAVPKLYLVSQLERILVVANMMNTTTDYLDGIKTSRVLTDILIDNEQVLNFSYAEFQYVSADYPMRRYKFLSNTELSKIALSIKLRYKNGEESNLIMPSGSSFFLTLSFFKL